MITFRRGAVDRATVTVPLVAQLHLTAAVLFHVHLLNAYRVTHLQPGGLVQRDAFDRRNPLQRHAGLALLAVDRGAHRDVSAGIFRGNDHRSRAFCTGDGACLSPAHQLGLVDVPDNRLAHHRTAEAILRRGGIGNGVEPVRIHAVRAGGYRNI